MSLSPNNIFHRLQELRLWQQNHETSRNFENTKNSSAYRTIEGLSAFDSTNDRNSPLRLDWESKPVSPVKSFDTLLEEKLREDPGPGEVPMKPKRPFLRKGTGLERFRMKLDEPKRVTKTKSAKIKRNLKKNFSSDKTEITPLKVPELAVKATWTTVADTANSVQTINKLIQQPVTAEAGDQTLYETALERELFIFEALEQRVDNSSFCSTNSSIVKLLSSTPSKIFEKVPKHEAIVEEKHVNFEQPPRPDLADFLLRLQQFSENNRATAAATPNFSPIELSDEDKWSEMSSSVSSGDLESTMRTVEQRDVGVGTSDTSSLETELRVKIERCDREIENLQLEQSKIAETKKQLQRQRENFEKEMAEKRRLFENEKVSFLDDIETEKKKLTKEKLVFQTYAKDSRNRPDKKEREEIGNLKREVADLSETLKLKESKNGMTQARLRNQIKQLERDNVKLKEEVEKLTRENAKLVASQKFNRRPSDVKILQEINKNVNELTKKNRTSEGKEAKNNKRDVETRKDDEDAEIVASTTARGSRTSRREKAKNNKRDDEDAEIVAPTTARGSRTSWREETKNNKGDVEDAEIIASTTARGSRTSRRESEEEDSLLEMITAADLEREYRNAFGKDLQQNVTLNDSKKNEKTEEILEDGSRQIKYHNGNTKVISQDGNVTIMKYYNGDIKQTSLLEGIIKYFFHDKNIWQTTYADGTELIEFPEGQKEKRYGDGRCQVFFPDDIVQTIFPNGTQEVQYPDGSVLNVATNGDKILLLPNGQREIRTKEHTRREFPDGTVKLLYPDGSQETRYANGRVRRKDATGALIVDTQT